MYKMLSYKSIINLINRYLLIIGIPLFSSIFITACTANQVGSKKTLKVTLLKSSIKAGTSTTATISISGSAPSLSNVTVTITNSNNLSIMPTTCTLNVFRNQDSCQVTVTGQLAGNGTITASAPDYISAEAKLTILDIFAYVVYSIDQSTGVLMPLSPQSMITAGVGAYIVTVAPSGKFAYVVNQNDRTISTYNINQTTGALTALPVTPATTGTEPYQMVITLSGDFAYIVDPTSQVIAVYMYSINQTTGIITNLGLPVAAGQDAYAIALDPNGKYAYVANYGDIPGSISMYSILNTGILAPLTPPTVNDAGDGPFPITVDPFGKFAYVNTYNDNPSKVLVYRIDPVTGLLTQQFSTATAGGEPYAIIFTPAGNFAYVVNYGDNNISMFRVNQNNGTLFPLNALPVPTGMSPYAMVIY
jgi:6-phosphogluconolactonase